MGEKEYERMKVQMQGFSNILKINSFLCKFGIGSKIIDKEKNNLNDIQIEMDKLYTCPQKYMKYFSEYGFVPYFSIDFSMMEKSIHLFEEGKVEESIENISNYYSSEKIEERFFLIKNSDINYERIRFIRNALEDYKNERYYAVIPILLMMIDGMVSDIMRYGMHSEKGKLSTWDMFDVENDGLKFIKDIFLQGRNKTTTEDIHFPYRNGILHGRDLGYDTKEVAILSWVYLFAVIDFIKNKKSENDRKDKYIQDTKKISFREMAINAQKLEQTKKNISQWNSRVISDEYVLSINEMCNDEHKPECVVIKYLNYLQKANYGYMVKYEHRTDIITDKNYGIFAKKVREKFTGIELVEFKILSIVDSAPAVTVVNVELDVLYYGKEEKKNIEIRCIITAKNKTAVHGDSDAVWKIMPLYI